MKSAGHSRNYGSYGAGSVGWKINREDAVLLGGSRAVLMQLAHPFVAMGVSAYSSYMTEQPPCCHFSSPATLRI